MPDLLPEIHWDDGLLLRPQHLQAFQRHCVGLVSQLSLSRTFGYGVRRLKIREESIGNWIFEVNACDLVMPDGSVILTGQTAAVPPVEFRHLELDAPVLDVWLAIPLLNPAAPNVETETPGTGAPTGRRYVLDQVEFPDENTGTNPQTIQVKRLNARIFIGQAPPQGHATLRIAKLKKVITEGEEGRRYELSRDFVPACLSIDASPQLHAIVKDILDRVEEKNAELLGHLRGLRDLLTGESMERPETLLKLQATNSILPVLRQLVGQPEMHPFDLYLQLCRLVGDLAIFGDDWEPPRLVIYDHDDPLRAFQDFKRAVLGLLERAVDTTVERQPFVASASPGVWEIEIPSHFLEGGVDLYLGIETGASEQELAPAFAEGRTVLASPEELPVVRRARIEGVPCRMDPDIHPSLKGREGLVFLRVGRTGDFWTAVASSRKLALAGEAAADTEARFYLYGVGIRASKE